MSPDLNQGMVADLREIGRAWWVRAAVVLVLALLAGVLAGYRINLSRSLPLGLYKVVGGSGEEVRGSVVIVCLPPEWVTFALQRGILGPGRCEGGSYGLGKIVLAAGGDEVELEVGGMTVNGVNVPHSRPIDRDRFGQPIAHFPYRAYRLDRDEVWLYAPHPAAFDSRYFGPVSITRIQSAVRPIWTASHPPDDLVPSGARWLSHQK